MVRRVLAVLMLIAALALGNEAAAASSQEQLPDSMGALGDSITRGFNACGWFVDCTSRSWSAGDNTGVNSHFRRLQAIGAPIAVPDNRNLARSGAKSAAMPGQADAAADAGVDYVTLLSGANDACTSSEDGMTSVAEFRRNIDGAMERLRAGLPDARIFVASIPDIKRLWEVGKGSRAARGAWGLFDICQSMLKNPTSDAEADRDRRDRVRQRVIGFNAQLEQACSAYGPQCVWDGGAVFAYPFTLDHVSRWDYFHPNATGQRILSAQTFGKVWSQAAIP